MKSNVGLVVLSTPLSLRVPTQFESLAQQHKPNTDRGLLIEFEHASFHELPWFDYGLVLMIWRCPPQMKVHLEHRNTQHVDNASYSVDMSL